MLLSSVLSELALHLKSEDRIIGAELEIQLNDMVQNSAETRLKGRFVYKKSNTAIETAPRND